MLPIELQARAMKQWRILEHEATECKCLRHLALAIDMKSFIRKDAVQGKGEVSNLPNKELPQGGTRWNPTHEQIEILERLYHSGMRTPTADQIQQITLELSKYGKIEGKNVFYWFQNHKARERQKMKQKQQQHFGNFSKEEAEENLNKRKFELWELMKSKSKSVPQDEEDEDQRRTLKLFPLHPERKL